MHRLESKLRTNRSRKTVGNTIITFPGRNPQQSKTTDRSGPVSIQRINASERARQRYYDEYIVVDREKQAATGKWVLNVIAAREAHKKGQLPNENDWYMDDKQSPKVSKNITHVGDILMNYFSRRKNTVFY
jgi:hypothetical protein